LNQQISQTIPSPNESVEEQNQLPSTDRRQLLRDLIMATGLGVLTGFDLLWTRPKVRAAEDAKDAKWGTLKGQIVWGKEGELPERKPIDLDKYNLPGDDKKWFLSQGPILAEDWVVHKESKGVRWVFVWLVPEPKDGKLAVHPDLEAIKVKQVAMEQPCSGFAPHALALREGQELLVKNDSPIFHAVAWSGHPKKNPGSNKAMMPKSSFTIDDLKADRFPVKIACAPHPWESAWLRIFDHPYFAVTDENGKFEFKQAPAGPCRVLVWQESAGWRGGEKGREGEKVTVEGAGVTDLGAVKLTPNS
jgi:hypothetical protein